jgi:hypothetical protein
MVLSQEPEPPALQANFLYAQSHSNGVIYCYSEPRIVLLQLPPSRDAASPLRLGIVAELDSNADILDIGRLEV